MIPCPRSEREKVKLYKALQDQAYSIYCVMFGPDYSTGLTARCKRVRSSLNHKDDDATNSSLVFDSSLGGEEASTFPDSYPEATKQCLPPIQREQIGRGNLANDAFVVGPQ